MRTKATLLRASRAGRRIAGHDARPTGPTSSGTTRSGTGSGEGGAGTGPPRARLAQRRGAGGLRSRRRRQRRHRSPIGLKGATHPPTVRDRWIYAFCLNQYVRGTVGTRRWRPGVHVHEELVADLASPTGFRPVYRDVPGDTFVPGYRLRATQSPHGIVAHAPTCDPVWALTVGGTPAISSRAPTATRPGDEATAPGGNGAGARPRGRARQSR